ncbi:hypothetical protein KCU73_g39, partial [Aureobasidium melanogenum]
LKFRCYPSFDLWMVVPGSLAIVYPIRIWHIVGLFKVETYFADNKQVRKFWSRSFLHRRLILVPDRFLWENHVHVMTLLSLSNL